MNHPLPVAAKPGEGRILRAFGEEITFHLTAEQTDGRLTSFFETTPPGGGPPPHYHEREDELFLVLDGRVEFLIEGNWSEVPVGSVVYVPRGAKHTFRNCGDAPLRMYIQAMPSGFETFFQRSAEEFAKPGEPDMEKIMAIAAEHGIHFLIDS